MVRKVFFFGKVCPTFQVCRKNKEKSLLHLHCIHLPVKPTLRLFRRPLYDCVESTGTRVIDKCRKFRPSEST